MLHIKNPNLKTQMISRLARIEGQLRGVQKMIADDRDCTEIVQQLVAIRSAMQSASLSFMQNAVNECLLDMEVQENPELQRENLTDLINLISKLSA